MQGKSIVCCMLSLTAVVLAALAMPATAQTQYTFTTVDHPLSAGLTFLTGITGPGAILGWYEDATTARAFTYRDGVFTPIPPPPGSQFMLAGGNNPSGAIVGRSDLGGFLLKKGTYSPLVNPQAYPGPYTFPEAISASGAIVGEFYNYPDGIQLGFLLTKGVYTPIEPPGANPFFGTWASGVNAARSVVGYAYDDDYVAHGFLLNNGVFTQLDDPDTDPTIGSAPFGINDLGTVVGLYFGPSDGLGHGYVLQNGVFATLDPPGSFYTVPDRINNAGTIVGWYYDADGHAHGFVATPVP